MSTGGIQFWTRRVLRSAPIVAGHQILQADYTFAARPLADAGGAGVVGMAAGGAVFQRSLATLRAPLDLTGELVSLSVTASSEDSYFRWKRIASLAKRAPVAIFYEDPIEEAWPIFDARTSYRLSRYFPFDLVAFADYTPSVWIADAPDGTTEDAQTVVTTSPPSASEVTIDDTSRSDAIETPDLSAEAGRLLVVRYHPLRLFTLESISREAREPNGLSYEISLREFVEAKDW